MSGIKFLLDYSQRKAPISIIYFFSTHSRNEGLSWIIIALWNLGEQVTERELPDFLDQKGKEFLMQKSKKEVELRELNSMISIQMDIYK